MRNLVGIFILAILLGACNSHENPQQAFFDGLSDLCDEQYYGASVFPDDPEDAMYGSKLTMTVESCTDREIRVPFYVDEDSSRTWVITRTDEGLLLKHDHRYPDGTPHELTNYGGYASESGTATRQFFEADAETEEMLPEASTNVWMLEIDKDNNQFIYYLERHDKPRFRAEFSMVDQN